jgi:hypothetical protein
LQQLELVRSELQDQQTGPAEELRPVGGSLAFCQQSGLVLASAGEPAGTPQLEGRRRLNFWFFGISILNLRRGGQFGLEFRQPIGKHVLFGAELSVAGRVSFGVEVEFANGVKRCPLTIVEQNYPVENTVLQLNDERAVQPERVLPDPFPQRFDVRRQHRDR